MNVFLISISINVKRCVCVCARSMDSRTAEWILKIYILEYTTAFSSDHSFNICYFTTCIQNRKAKQFQYTQAEQLE